MDKRYLPCASCGQVYSVSLRRDPNNIFICQDCAEKQLALIQHRPPKLIYKRKYACVRAEGDYKDGNNY